MTIVRLTRSRRPNDQASGFTFDPGWSGSGTFSDGQIVTVTKAVGGLSIPSDPRPLLWIPGESGFARDTTYSRSTSTLTAQTNATLDTSVKPTNAAGSLKQVYGTGGGSPANWFAEDPPWEFATGICLMSCKRRYNFTPTSANNDKCFRVWPAAFGTPDIYHKVASSGAASITVEGYTSADDAMSSGSHFFTINHPLNEFIVDEHLHKDSALDAFDGIARWYRNGARAHSESIGWRTRSSTGEPGTAVKTLAYPDQYSNQDTSGDMIGHGYEEHISHIYLTDSLFRFILSTESEWTQTTMNGSNDPAIKREYQLPTEGSGSDIGCGLLLRKGVHASTSGLYLWFYHPDGSAPQRVGVCD